MHSVSITQAFVLGLLASAPIAASFSSSGSQDLERRYVGSGPALAAKLVRSLAPGVEARHHTEAQIAAKAAKGSKKKNNKREAQAPDEFGPWDTEEDEFGSWTDKREPHHTEAQIAAKAAKGSKKKQNKREPHHTEAQIAAKAAKGSKKKNNKREAQAPDEFGPWDTEEDEFGSWTDKREAHHTEAQIAAKAAKGSKKAHNKREAHHTEAQIAAKAAKGAKKNHAREAAAEAQAPDEFGPWDTEEDEFGSWTDKREAHHTEAQIAAKAAKGSKKAHNKRHHTEAQIAAKAAKAGGKKTKGN